MTGEIDLSDREQEILRLVATGASNKEIAQQLVISTNTVKVHLRNIFAKIGVTSRTEATLFAMRQGLVPFPAILPADGRVETMPATGLDAEGGVLALSGEAISAPAAGEELLEKLPQPRAGQRRMTLVSIGLLLAAALLILGSIDFRRQPPGTSSSAAVTLVPMVRWESRASLPVARSALAAAVYEGQIYAIGGDFSGGVGGTVTRYNADTNTWQALSPKPIPVADIGAVLLGEKIYVPGGRSGSGQPTDAMEVYDPRRNTWEDKAPLPLALSGYALAAFEGKLYLFGGWDGNQVLDRVFVYDPDQDRWSEKTRMPAARAYASAASVADKIFVVGGFDGKQALAVNEVYYPPRDGPGETPWEDRADMPESRYHMGIAALADILYLLGGETNTGDSIRIPSLEYLSTADSWTSFDAPLLPIGASPAVVPLKNYVYVFGGLQDDHPVSLHQAYHAIFTIQIPVIH